MKYDDELCKLVIRNMAIVEEAPNVVAEVQKLLFSAINERIEKSVEKHGYSDWDAVYELVTGEADETSFNPENADWLPDRDNNKVAYYILSDEGGDGLDWLSCAVGSQNASLSLRFVVTPELGEVNRQGNRRRLQALYNDTPALQNAGFQYSNSEAGYIYVPFVLDAEALATEFPDFDKALEPLDKILDALFSVHSVFDGFVKKLIR